MRFMSDNEDEKLLKSLFEARRKVVESGKMPENMWHPKYGWLIADGMVTEAGGEFYKDMMKDEK